MKTRFILTCLTFLTSTALALAATIPVGQSKIISTRGEISKAATGNPAVADVVPLGPHQLLIVGKGPGTTQVVTWSAEGGTTSISNVEVTLDLETFRSKLHEVFPEERPKIQSVNGSLVLSGQVSSLSKMDAIVALAKGYISVGSPTQQAGGSQVQGVTGGMPTSYAVTPQAGGNQNCAQVINLMQVGGSQQVMLEVKVAEVARSTIRKLATHFNIFGVDVGANQAHVAGYTSGDGANLIGNAIISNTMNLAAEYVSHGLAFNIALEASKENDAVKILAEPTLTTMSGQEAKFLSGGEFPIPVAQAGGNAGSITIDYKEFGVGIKFLPVVLDSKRINLRVNTDVSEISNVSSVIVQASGVKNVLAVPSLSKRMATSTVELADGQTMVLAGLISDNMRQAATKFPGLGDVPVFGQLFRSSDYQADQTELLIFVTPHLSGPIPKDKVRLPTATFVAPSDAEFYLLGRMEGNPLPAPQGGGFEGTYGQEF